MTNNKIKEIGSRIKKIRKAKHQSQDTLSERAQIASNYLWEIENGRVNMSVDVFIRLSEALEVSPNQLLGIDTPPDTDIILSEITEIFSGCTPSEIQLILKIMKSVRNAITETNKE